MSASRPARQAGEARQPRREPDERRAAQEGQQDPGRVEREILEERVEPVAKPQRVRQDARQTFVEKRLQPAVGPRVERNPGDAGGGIAAGFAIPVDARQGRAEGEERQHRERRQHPAGPRRHALARDGRNEKDRGQREARPDDLEGQRQKRDVIHAEDQVGAGQEKIQGEHDGDRDHPRGPKGAVPRRAFLFFKRGSHADVFQTTSCASPGRRAKDFRGGRGGVN